MEIFVNSKSMGWKFELTGFMSFQVLVIKFKGVKKHEGTTS